jgi:hypothetical protein
VRYLCAVLLAGCSFSKPVGSVQSDAPNEIDAAVADTPTPDTMEMPQPDPCPIGVTSTTGTDRGRVGGGGGGANFGPLACDAATDRIVGFAVRLSNQNTIFNAPSARGLTIACATVTVDRTTGVGTTGTVYTKEVMGSGQENWSPSTQSATATCPAGQVVNGLSAYTGTNQNLFNNVDFRCGKLDGTAQTTSSSVVHVAGSGSNTSNHDTVNCNANELLVRLPNMTGSGFDSANVFCAPATCL